MTHPGSWSILPLADSRNDSKSANFSSSSSSFSHFSIPSNIIKKGIFICLSSVNSLSHPLHDLNFIPQIKLFIPQIKLKFFCHEKIFRMGGFLTGSQTAFRKPFLIRWLNLLAFKKIFCMEE